ncbi:biliverdin-producing heme oxygenase [Arcticibacter tournemirensis]
MLSALLKDQTRQPHQSLEKLLIGRLKDIRSKADYGSVLRLFYGFIAPLERKISRINIESILSDCFERRKALSLLNDMEVLQSGTYELEQCYLLPDIRNTSDALGALYVLEGSTLGGQLISKMIKGRLEVPDTTLTYFNSYGDNTPVMWSRFRQVLDNTPAIDHKEVIKSATDTFETFKNWIARHEQKEL